jgi:CubicO group peptidase (beta-lactamase class C family)
MKTNSQNDMSAAIVAFFCIASLIHGICQAETAKGLAAVTNNTAIQSETKSLRDTRHQFQLQELIPAAANMWIFNPGAPPRIVWRDGEQVAELGFKDKLRVRWFNARLEEVPVPTEPGRWAAWIEGTAPNGLPFRRAMTFYARPQNFLFYFAPELGVSLPYCPGPITSEVWHEHSAELSRFSAVLLPRAINDSEAGAILLAGLTASKPLGRPARYVDSVDVLNEDFHLALKLKLQGLSQHIRPLRPARRRAVPAAALREGELVDAGVNAGAKAKIDAVCRAWAEDTGEPFVTLVARHGIIVTHEAFGNDKSGNPINLEYRCWVGSITKSVTALLFGEFHDQGLIDLDDSLATVFPEYPKNDPHVPTFRQCFNHTSGLSGHGDFGGVRNPHLENIVLNAIDVNEPDMRYSYSGNGYELAAKAMEVVAGKSFMRLYNDHLFRPLNFGDVPMGNASSDGQFTAMELAVLAQLIANRGSYGDLEFISPRTFDRLLPEPLHVADRGSVEDEGIGLHWIRRLKPDAPAESKRAEDQLFSSRTVGHGSLSGCILLIDLDQQIVVTQARRQTGPRYGEWSNCFFQAIADLVERGEPTPTGSVSLAPDN